MNNIYPKLVTLGLLAMLSPALAQTERPNFAAADVCADLAYLAETLPLAHFNLYAYVGQPAFIQAYQAGLKSLGADSVSRRQATLLFQRYAAVANTGHCEVNFPVADYITFARRGGTVFPLELAFEDGKVYVRRNFSGEARAAGAQVLSIDQVPIGQIRAGIHPYLSGERPALKDAKLEFWSFPRLYWSVFGEKKAFELKLKNAAGKIIQYRVAAIPVMEFEQQRGGEVLSAKRFFRYEGTVAYLHPGAFGAAAADGEARFRTFVDSAFSDFRARRANTLVLDLRNNAGGDNSYSDYLIAYLASKPFRWYSKFSLKTSAVLKAHTRQQAAAPGDTSDYARAILRHGNGEVFSYDFPPQDPVPAAKRFTGRVLVLVNRQTYSMAAVSAALLQDYGFAKIVGEETADLPTLHASQFSFILPRTGIEVKVPKGYIVRPNGSAKRTGVRPDYRVRDHLLDEQDEVLTYLLTRVLRPGAAAK